MTILDQAREEAQKREFERMAAGYPLRDVEQFEELVLEIYHDAMWEQYKRQLEDQYYQDAMQCRG